MMSDWTLFSNYGHVLVCLARNRRARLRDVAVEVGITERAVQKIVRDLQDEGFLVVTKQGRCNRYRINNRKSLRHALESHCTVGKLLALVVKTEQPTGEDLPAKENQPPVERPLQAEAPKARKKLPEPSDAKKARKPSTGKSREKKPVDTRQQGSLF